MFRVRKLALDLAKSMDQRNPDYLVVEVAALLHDILDKKYRSPGDTDALARFTPFFNRVSPYVELHGSGRAKKIVKIVENVSWSTEKLLRESGGWGLWHEECIELHCVQDADRLDAIGAFGAILCSAMGWSH